MGKTLNGGCIGPPDEQSGREVYRASSLVFGGGHVVLPLLQAAVVPSGWVTNETFLASYGAAQAMPSPLFTFAAFLLVIGTLPFWEPLRHSVRTQAALAGVNAAVVGLLLAALYRPVWTNAIGRPQDFALALVALAALMAWKLPPWLVVLGSGALGWLLAVVS